MILLRTIPPPILRRMASNPSQIAAADAFVVQQPADAGADGLTRASEAIANVFLEACLLDVAAVKPGNVGFHRADRGMHAIDLVRSARVAATVIARPGLRVSERIHSTLGAVRAATGASPNAGIVLLGAPLVHAALGLIGEHEDHAFALNVARALEYLTQADGSLGASVQREERLARLIAPHFESHYAEVRERGLPRLTQARQRGRDWRWTVTEVFLGFLAARPDAYVARRHGEAGARELIEQALDFDRMAARATDLQRLHIDLVEWDRRLKVRRVNPRECADLTAATVLWARLDRPATKE